jgi:hypothetical protein
VNGTVYTDHLVDTSSKEGKELKVHEIESYNVSEIWDALKQLNLDCLFVLLLGVSEKTNFYKQLNVAATASVINNII